MRKLMFAVLAFASLPALASNWVTVRNTPVENTFADTDSIRQVLDGGGFWKVRVWIVTKAKSNEPRAKRVLAEVQCAQGKVRYVQVDYIADGVTTSGGLPNRVDEWRFAPPDSEEEAALPAACKRR